MNFYYGTYGANQMMAGWGGTMAVFGFLTWLVWFTAGVLLVVWLWKQIQK